MNSNIKIMLIEDSPDYRKVIDLAFEHDKFIHVTHKIATAERALDILRATDPDKYPDVILLDLGLPGMSGQAAVTHLLTAVPTAKILVLTQSDKEEDVLHAIYAGATGYLLKSSGIKQLKEGIKNLIDGGSPLDAKVAQFILRTLRERPAPANEDCDVSSREVEILHLMGEGLVKKEIAAKLQISPFTVQSHVRNIYEKLHVQNAPSAVSQAYRKGVLPVSKMSKTR
jgi:DNA-binding NarL/FixJ family response regulator